MSYILDALRRADAERERGAVPGLHAQPDMSELEPAARDRKPLLLAAAGAGALLVAVVAVLVVAPWRGAPTSSSRVAAAGEEARTPAMPAPPAVLQPAAPPAIAPPPANPAPGLAALAPDGTVRRSGVAP